MKKVKAYGVYKARDYEALVRPFFKKKIIKEDHNKIPEDILQTLNPILAKNLKQKGY